MKSALVIAFIYGKCKSLYNHLLNPITTFKIMLLDIQPFFKEILSNHVAIAALSGALVAWITTLFTIRKDEKNVYIKQITEERTKWRTEIRTITQKIVASLSHKTMSIREKHILRAELALRLSPFDEQDKKILATYDSLDGSKIKLDEFTQIISLLLKHDWERVKWESMPFYMKWFSYLFTPKNLIWKTYNYRDIKTNKELKHHTSTIIDCILIGGIAGISIMVIICILLKLVSSISLSWIIVIFISFVIGAFYCLARMVCQKTS